VTRPIQHTHHRGLLILVEPQVKELLPGTGADLNESDVDGLLRWVARGNALLVCSRQNTALYRAMDIMASQSSPAEADVPRKVEPGEAGRYTSGLKQIEVGGRDTLQSDQGLALWSLDGRPAALLLRHGEGRVLVVADPSFLTRRRLHKGADNLVFLYNVATRHARDGRVYFDEYHHGIQSGGGFFGYLQYHGQQWALVPMLLAGLVAIWAVAVRLGPAVLTPRGARADAVDYASALARIYQKAGTHEILARSLARGFLTRLTRHLHLRRSALPAEVLAAWQQRYPKEPGRRLQQLLKGAMVLRRAGLSERQLLSWVQAFDRFEKNVLSSPVDRARVRSKR
jgi:hypothetical protein